MKHLTPALRALFIAVLGTLGAGLASAAHAQTLTVTAPASWQPTNDTTFDVEVGYSLPAGSYANIVIELPWPDPGIAGSVTPTFVTSAYAGTFSFSQAFVNNQTVYRWSAQNLVVTGTGTSGAIVVSTKIPRFGALAGTPYTWAPTLSGSLTASAVPATTTVATTPDLAYHDANMISTQWVVGHNNLGNGLLVRYDFRIRNDGNAQVLSGMTFSVALGKNSYFVRAFGREDNFATIPDPPETTLSIVSAPAAWTRPAQGAPADVVIASTNRPLGTAGGGTNWSPHLHVDVFIPCQYIGLDARDNPLLTATVVTVGETARADGPNDTHTAHLNALTEVSVTPPHAAWKAECGDGGGLSKQWDGETRGVDTNLQWLIFVDPPSAVLPFEKAMIVDVIPPGITAVSVTIATPNTPSPTDAPGFDAYFCDFSPADLASLTVDTFPNVAPTRCATAWDATRNHIVFWAPEGWGSADLGIQIAFFDIFTYVPANWLATHDSPMTTFAWFQGRSNGVLWGGPDTAPENPWSDDAYRDIDDRSVPLTEDYNYAVDMDPGTAGTQTPLMTVARGQSTAVSFRIHTDTRRTPAKNPRLTITPPPGVVIDSVSESFYHSFYPTCDPNIENRTTPPPSPWSGPLTWRFGESNLPYGLTYYCAAVRVDFTPADNYPFVNGQELPFTATVTAENQVAPHSATTTYHVTVPPEMRVAVDASCWQPEGRPGFRITSLNTGGVDLTGVVTRFTVPASATYAGLSPEVDNIPNGAIFEVSTNGVDWVTTNPGDSANPAVRFVRLRNFGLAAGLDAVPVRFKVLLTTGIAVGQQLTGSAVMSADGLAPTPVTSGSMAVGFCPSDIAILKFFDADESGAQDGAGELLLPGWTFVLTDGATTYAQVVGDNGVALFEGIPAGLWQLSELPPETVDPLGPQGTWHQTTGITEVIVSGDGVFFEVYVGNHCECDIDEDANACTYSLCNYDGYCTVPEVPVADGASCQTDKCSFGECADGTCIEVDTVNCADASRCSVDSCDPATGCVHEGPDCGAVTFFGTVSDGVRTGQVRCSVTAGQAPVCDTEADGVTLVIVWNAPSTCGEWRTANPGD